MEKKEIEELIAMRREDMENIKGYWNEIPLEGLSGVYYDLADNSEEIGIFNILLGNKQEALDWFKKANDYYKKEIENMDKAEPGINYALAYRNLIYSAILTQDEKIIKDTAQYMCNVENEIFNRIMKQRAKKYPMLIYHQGFILANLIVGNDDKVKYHLSAFKRNYKRPLKDGYLITDAVGGILEKNPKLTKEGIEKILKRHNRLIKRPVLSEEEKLVCIPAIRMLILAKFKGMNINDVYIESKYIPKFLFEENE